MSIEPCPFESTKRSRSGQPGLAGLWRRWSFQSTSAMSAIPIGIPGWPDFARSTASIASARTAFASSRRAGRFGPSAPAVAAGEVPEDPTVDAAGGYWGRMSPGSTPATTFGFFIASRRNGSPSSWLRITSMNVVTPVILRRAGVRERGGQLLHGLHRDPLHPARSATRAKLKDGFSSVPTKLLSYHRVVFRFSAPHW